MKPFFLIFLLAVPLLTADDPYTVRPIIGSGAHGDGGPATQALFDGPFGLVEDAAGNVYISESNAGVIRRIRPDGVAERFAGSGVVSDGPEGVAALSTDLLHPTVLLLDQDGGLVFADTQACRIRKVLTNGTIQNLVGTGACSGSGGPGGGSRDGRALEIDIGTVSGMVLDSAGRLMFSEETGHILRRLDTDGMVRTVAGVGSAGFSGDDGFATSASFRSPRGIAYDSAGNLYVADSGNCRVRRINTDGVIETIAGTGSCATASTTVRPGIGATSQSIGRITALGYDKTTDSLFIGSPAQYRVFRYDVASGLIYPFLGSGAVGQLESTAPLERSIHEPSAILASERAGILVSDRTSFTVLQVKADKATVFAGFWPHLDNYPSAASAPLLRPAGLCINAEGTVLAVDAGAERILAFRAPDGLTAIAGARYPTGYTAGDGGLATKAQIGSPKRIACAPNGDIYLSQAGRIRLINKQGVISTLLELVRVGNAAGSLNDPTGLAIDSEGRLLISEAGAHRVIRYDIAARTGTLIAGTGTAGFSGDGEDATEARLNSPGDLAFDSQGNLLIADRGNRRVRQVSPGGIIQTVVGSTRSFSNRDISGEIATQIGLGAVDGLAVDASGNIYISEYPRVGVVRTDGRFYILTGYLGEDDNGVKSYLNGPLSGCDGLAVDKSRRLYVSLREGGRVIVAAPPGVPPVDATSAPSISAGGVVSSAAFGGFTAIAPGSWVEIYGSNLSTTTRQWAASDFNGIKAPTALDGTSVSIGGQPAFVSYISPNQVNVQAPSNIAAGAQSLTVTTAAGQSSPYTVTVDATQPGFLAPPAFKIADRQYLTATLSDGATYVMPVGAMANARPARPGELITLYGVGFGAVTPQIGAGEIVQQLNSLTSALQIFFAGTPATVTYAGLSPGGIGLYQFNVVVPNVTADNAVPVTFTLGGASGQQTLYTSIQN